jgi:hypothetical protein
VVLRVDEKLMSRIYNRYCSSSTLMDARGMLQLLVEAWVLPTLRSAEKQFEHLDVGARQNPRHATGWTDVEIGPKRGLVVAMWHFLQQTAAQRFLMLWK